MMQKYEVFINHHRLKFTNNPTNISSNVYYFNKDFNWQIILSKFQEKKPQDLLVISEDLESCWKQFRRQFVNVRAAGGLVVCNDYFLFIYRNGKWDLPKGKMETGEGVEETALREVKEECGINNLTLKKHLINTYHIYPFDKGWIFKQTDWFLMRSSQPKHLIPQTEEGIEEVKWIRNKDVGSYLKQSYQTISIVIKTHLLSIEIPSGKN
ncbi:MAG: NUDIX domain-containing protein [Bacteroidota bacterium]|nr:NUDIX domain-containing protein [Bacteroidota bacterium]